MRLVWTLHWQELEHFWCFENKSSSKSGAETFNLKELESLELCSTFSKLSWKLGLAGQFLPLLRTFSLLWNFCKKKQIPKSHASNKFLVTLYGPAGYCVNIISPNRLVECGSRYSSSTCLFGMSSRVPFSKSSPRENLFLIKIHFSWSNYTCAVIWKLGSIIRL